MNLIDSLLFILVQNGGAVVGNESLYRSVPFSERHIRYGLRYARRMRLITSSNKRGGRGHKATHKLTVKGWIYVQPK